MRSHILAENNWKTIKEQPVELAVLPWGATEAHNYHMPYGTDIYEAEAVAAKAAELANSDGADAIVLPCIPFGVNTGQRDIKLDINLYPSTQMAILDDVIETLSRQGICKLMILNSHGGNNFKPILRELGAKYPSMLLTFCNWFQSMDKSNYFDHPDGDHADEMETSLILHMRPELVKMEQAGDGAAKQWKINGLNESWAWAERQWSRVTEDTGVGDPREATAQKGERFFKDVTEKVARLMVDMAGADLDDLYE